MHNVVDFGRCFRFVQVRRLKSVHCHRDPAWTLELLTCAAPTLEELQVDGMTEEHLRVVHSMPRLRLLDISGVRAFTGQPPKLPAVAQSSLWRLRVEKLPRTTLVSMLQAHSRTLAQLWLGVGEAPCSGLGDLLRECSLRLSRVVLYRPGVDPDHNVYCDAELSEVRSIFPAATVQCYTCSDIGFWNQED